MQRMADHISVQKGKQKIALVFECARAHTMCKADLRARQRLFWKIWGHPDLIAFPLVAASRREIRGLAQSMWNEQLDSFGIERRFHTC